MPLQTDPVASIPSDNVELQLVVANAVYRIGQAQANDRQTALQALDAGIAAYLTVLKNTARQEHAAFNYEYLVRLRGDIAKGRRPPSGADVHGPEGRAGAPPGPEGNMNDFKIQIPLEPEELGAIAGKAAPMKR